nr:tyrosine-protein phosphatase [Azomonas macrocytogenes]
MIFTPCPGLKDTSLDSALDTLQAAGAEALITLMPQEELNQNQIVDLPERCAHRNLEWFHLPVADEQEPEAAFDAAWAAAWPRIHQLLDEGRSPAIHCKGGSGRTGLIAARILITCGVPPAEAIAQVQALRPRSIQNSVHMAWIGQFDVK